MKIALVITAKNEERLLRQNLLYHRAIGLDRAFVYFDNTTDKGKESIADLDFVKTEDSVPTEKYTHLDALKKFTSQAKEHHTARQCLNTFDALQQCQQEGIDWLISIDADELVTPDLKQPCLLGDFFIEISPQVDVVNFQVKEMLQNRFSYTHVFAEATLFKARASFKRRFDNVFKHIYNPFNKSGRKYNYWYGHTMGKTAIRVNADVIPKNVHRFVNKEGSKVKSINQGYILHYHSYDFNDFIKKFKNFEYRPDTFLSGNAVEDIKLLWRDVVNHPGFSQKELEDYYRNNVMFNEEEIRKLLKPRHYLLIPRKQAVLEKIEVVEMVFKTENLHHENN